ncbi:MULTISPECIES: D-inositol-3-phosphate glycosyltransferase [unclassified Dietzia]|uniref:D-inositol-3-phosphate glycosyltransferase n=2 Tax=Dietzia TaxID=37914 RepID=UPI001E2F781B|nr:MULTISPECIES: D-inositol-3-phosphate glycosyltransferase [unclassified Dietzia]
MTVSDLRTGAEAPLPRRIAVLSFHTSPLAQPGTGDAGGLNVYVLQTARRLARRGVEVEVFTRATHSSQPPVEQAGDGVLVRNIVAGPFEGLCKEDLPTQLCPFVAGVMRAEAGHAPGHYDLIHSHYWLSGQAGLVASEHWGVPLVHTAHTLAEVKNAVLADGDVPEPESRRIGEQQIVDSAHRLVVNTTGERDELVGYYDADPAHIDVVPPGADLEQYTPGTQRGTERARRALGLGQRSEVVAFVGRIQPLKAPDVIVRALAEIVREQPHRDVRLMVVGGPSGSGLERPRSLMDLADELGVADRVSFLAPRPPAELVDVYRAADVVAVPSYSESFGLVALEAQACGTPVVAAAVGGLPTAVDHGRTGITVVGHDPREWAATLVGLLDDDARRLSMSRAAPVHASRFSWDSTADGLLASYAGTVAAHRARREAATAS